MHKTQKPFSLRKKKKKEWPQGFGHFYGHLKHKNDYTPFIQN